MIEAGSEQAGRRHLVRPSSAQDGHHAPGWLACVWVYAKRLGDKVFIVSHERLQVNDDT